MPRSVSRRETPQSPPKLRVTATETIEPAQLRRSTRAGRHDPHQDASQAPSKKRRQLESVVEHEDTIVAAVTDSLDDGADDDTHQTDAVISLLDELVSREPIDLRSLDIDEMIDDLSVLGQLADNVLELAQAYYQGPTTGDENAIDRVRTRMQKQSAQLETIMSTYALNSSLLRIDQLRQFFEQEPGRGTIPVAGYRGLEAVLAKANLARFITILVTDDELSASKSAMGLIVHLCDVDTFPDPFMNTIPTETHGDIWDLKVDILTQRFIVGTLLADQQSRSFRPSKLLEAIFLEPGAGTSTAELTQERMRVISQTFTAKSKRPINTETLQQAFPWPNFVDSAIMWSSSRSVELDQIIAEKGGIKTIKQGLRTGLSNFTTAAGTAKAPVQPGPASKSPNVSGFVARVAQHDEWTDAARDLITSPLEGEDLSPEEEAARLATTAMAAEDVSDGGTRAELVTRRVQDSESPEIETFEIRSSGDADRDQAVLPESNEENTNATEPDRQPSPDLDGGEGASVFRELQIQNLEARKENLPPTTRTEPSISRANHNRRIIRERSSDDRGDEEAVFEQDARSPKRQRLHTVLHTRSASGRAASSASREQNMQPPDFTHPTRDDGPLLYTTQHEEFDAEQQAPTSSAVRYEEARRRIDTLVPFVRSTAPLAPPQARRPWSSREIGRLLDLMAEYGSAWATILKCDARSEDPCLQERSNVQLKDKARNMKFDFLKALQPLPTGFDGVSLSKHQLKQLDDARIPHS